MQERQEIQVQYLGWEDSLENGMATHSSILAWRIPWTEEPGGLQSTGSQELNTTEQLSHHHHGARRVPHSRLCVHLLAHSSASSRRHTAECHPPGVRASARGLGDTSGPQKAVKATTRPSICCPQGHVTISTDGRRAQPAGDFWCLLVGC